MHTYASKDPKNDSSNKKQHKKEKDNILVVVGEVDTSDRKRKSFNKVMTRQSSNQQALSTNYHKSSTQPEHHQ